MRTIRISLDEPLLEQIDEAAAHLGISRSAFLREAARRSVREWRIRNMERAHEESYKLMPQPLEEVDRWACIQDWGEP